MKLRSISEINDNDLESIFQNCKDLEVFSNSLGWSSSEPEAGAITDKSLHLLGKNCPNLRFLDLFGHTGFTSGTISYLIYH
jgi:hypothetical protein